MPSQSIFHYDGVAIEESAPSDWIDLDNNNFIPRGATMRGTNSKVIVLVVYTGSDTKIMLNNGDAVYKHSNMDRNLNWIYILALFQIIAVCSIFTIIGYNEFEENRFKETYLYQLFPSAGLYSLTVGLASWLIMIRYLPIDVIIQTESAKIIASLWMQADVTMISKPPVGNGYTFCSV